MKPILTHTTIIAAPARSIEAAMMVPVDLSIAQNREQRYTSLRRQSRNCLNSVMSALTHHSESGLLVLNFSRFAWRMAMGAAVN
jgi:hypothetical protein